MHPSEPTTAPRRPWSPWIWSSPWTRPWHWRWPGPALVTWLLAWALALGLARAQAPLAGLALALALSGAAALGVQGLVRRLMVAGGFPLSAAMLGLGGTGLAGGWWLLPLLPLLLLYPLRAWRDAPFFPTPAGALDGLAAVVGTPRSVLEAGCGRGDGLQALRQALPGAALSGVEWSPLLARLARWRCPWAQVRQGDLWAEDWSRHQLVYLFQRPETMPRAWSKAVADMPGGWLVSLEFPVPGVVPAARLDGVRDQCVWVYRVPGSMPVRPGR